MGWVRLLQFRRRSQARRLSDVAAAVMMEPVPDGKYRCEWDGHTPAIHDRAALVTGDTGIGRIT
jgi:hypothetical protein